MRFRVRINSFNVLRNEFECLVTESNSPNSLRPKTTICIDPFCTGVIKDDEPKQNFIGKEFEVEGTPFTVMVFKMTAIEYTRNASPTTDPETLDNTCN